MTEQLDRLKAFGSLNTGSMVFIKKLTADGSGTTLSFVDGSSDVVFDSTYKEYLFTFKICTQFHNVNFQFNMSVDGGSISNVTKTTTIFMLSHKRMIVMQVYLINRKDLAQSTGYQMTYILWRCWNR